MKLVHAYDVFLLRLQTIEKFERETSVFDSALKLFLNFWLNDIHVKQWLSEPEHFYKFSLNIQDIGHMGASS
jgi:hypothetical protein